MEFQNPVLLAAGTAAYGRELSRVVDLEALGGLITKAVSIERRHGARAPRVAEFDGGMINAVGLANPGVEEVRAEHLPWLASNVHKARVLVNVVGNQVEEFASVVSLLDDSPGFSGYELNVSCPNVKAGGLEFGADPQSLTEVITRARKATKKPIFVKLSPTLQDIGRSAQTAADAGADGISVVNTLPGLLIDVDTRKPVLGFGTGGVSGPGLLPVGVLATYKVAKAVRLPVIGVGGISVAKDIVQYVLAGASLVAIGTAAMQQPRLPERLVADLERWCREKGVTSLSELRGSLRWEN
jgi:dihydroorotate dehydrogenase (NAD+) catalytic subunit